MNTLSAVYGVRAWHTATLAPAAPAPADAPQVHADSAHVGAAHAAPAAAPSHAPAPLRDPQAGAVFCDAFNAGEGLPAKDLNDKIDLMCTAPLKLARCMPALFMSDVLGSYADLAKLSDRPAPVVWIDGDCHLGNFGIVQSKHGHAVWGLNDFDMSSPGSPAMDLDRLAFSLVSSMRERGLDAHASEVVDALARSYHQEIKEVASGEDDGMAYLNASQSSGHVRKLIEKSDAITRADWIQKYAARGSDGHWRFVYSDKIEAVDPRTSKAVSDALHEYDHGQGPTPAVARPLQILAVAQKLQSGGSSHGQPRYFALVENADHGEPPVILEVKQELPPPLVGWHGDDAAAIKASKPNWTGNLHKADATQVVRGQAAMGGDHNPLTGSTSIDGISYLVREREPCKATLSDKHFATVDDYLSFATQAGEVLGLAHGRTAGQAKEVLAWMGDREVFSKRLDAFAQAYASQAEADLAAYRAAHPQASAAAGGAIPDSQD